MKIKIYTIALFLSVICLIAAVTTTIIGSRHSSIYNQMKKAPIISSLKEINRMGDEPFLLTGNINILHPTIVDNIVAYTTTTYDGDFIVKSPELTITLNDGSIKLIKGYDIKSYNREICYKGTSYQGIKKGSDISIYCVSIEKNGEQMVKGYELYPGTPKQYINFLSSPFNAYMIYVRMLIGFAILLFIFSIILNNKEEK